MDNINLYLIRHGESVRNTMPDLIGQDAEEPLSKKGEDQAKALGRYFALNEVEFSHIYNSPYKRAWDTCRIASKHLVPPKFQSSTHALREYSAGDMKDKSRTEVYADSFLLGKMNELGMAFKFPNGESLFEVQQRAVSWLYDIIAEKDTADIALFTHGMVIKCFLQHFMQFDQRLTWRMKIDNTSVSSLSFKKGFWYINYINNIEHLKVL